MVKNGERMWMFNERGELRHRQALAPGLHRNQPRQADRAHPRATGDSEAASAGRTRPMPTGTSLPATTKSWCARAWRPARTERHRRLSQGPETAWPRSPRVQNDHRPKLRFLPHRCQATQDCCSSTRACMLSGEIPTTSVDGLGRVSTISSGLTGARRHKSGLNRSPRPECARAQHIAKQESGKQGTLRMNVIRLATGVIVRAPAKLNLFFEVLAKRSDGFHEVETLMAPISLYDTLVAAPRPDGALSLHCRWAAPGDGAQLSVRAGLVARRARQPGVSSRRICCAPRRLRTRVAHRAFETHPRGIRPGRRVERCGRGATGRQCGLGTGLEPCGTGRNSRRVGKRRAILSVPRRRRLPRPRRADRDNRRLGPVGFRRGTSAREPVDRRGVFEVPRGRTATPRRTPRRVAAARRHAPARRGAAQPAGRGGRDALALGAAFAARTSGADCLAAQLSGSGSAYFGICRHARHARRVAERLKMRGMGQVIAVSTSK